MYVKSSRYEGPVDAKRTILVVEDNALNREMLQGILQDEYEIIQAENGLVGLDVLAKHYEKISLVLLDVYMPKCDGFEFLRRRARDARFDAVPVIVTTASERPEDEVKCLQLGANDFVLKPYNVEVMTNRIRNTVRLRESASIVNQLTWDALTGLYSAEFFYRHVEDIFASSKGVEFDMVCSDIENFKSLNARYGTDVCDRLLRDLADRLVGAMPGFVVGGRLSGDSFAFLIEHQDRSWVDVLPGAIEGIVASRLGVKFGIAENVDKRISASQTCDRAMLAFEGLEDTYGAHVAWYTEELRKQQETKRIILESMETALEERQFVVYYQPKHDLRTGRIGGAEALVRWMHPELGFVKPADFVPIFERNGFITKVDMYVCEEACRQIKRCHDLGLPQIPLSFNASRLDFDEPDLAANIARIADAHGVDHSLLHIELTETAYSDDPERVVSAVGEIRGFGFPIELDDFGAGYSSLVSLNDLPLDIMKLDMSMIRQASALGDYRIVQTALQLARFMQLETVVEGVETADEVRTLKSMGCDMIQGYYYSRPLNQRDFEEYLAKQGE